MHDEPNRGANQPPEVPEPPQETPNREDGWREARLIGIGAAVGLALGIGFMFAVAAVFMAFSPSFLSTRESVQVFTELNELRQQLNEFNEQTKLRDGEKEAALRQALSTLETTAKTPNRESLAAATPAKKPSGVANGSNGARVDKSTDPFADIDTEVKRLQQTQQVLNTMLDILTSKHKERPQGR